MRGWMEDENERENIKVLFTSYSEWDEEEEEEEAKNSWKYDRKL